MNTIGPLEIQQFKEFLKDQEIEITECTDDPIGKMWIKGAFSIVQSNLDIEAEKESKAMASYFGEGL